MRGTRLRHSGDEHHIAAISVKEKYVSVDLVVNDHAAALDKNK